MSILYTSADLFAEMRERRGAANDWIETTQWQFDEMLGCLPPRMHRGPAFLMGEPVTHENGAELYAAFWHRRASECAKGECYLARLLTVREFCDLFAKEQA